MLCYLRFRPLLRFIQEYVNIPCSHVCYSPSRGALGTSPPNLCTCNQDCWNYPNRGVLVTSHPIFSIAFMSWCHFSLSDLTWSKEARLEYILRSNSMTGKLKFERLSTAQQTSQTIMGWKTVERWAAPYLVQVPSELLLSWRKIKATRTWSMSQPLEAASNLRRIPNLQRPEAELGIRVHIARDHLLNLYSNIEVKILKVSLGPGYDGGGMSPSCAQLQVFDSTSYNSEYQHVIWTKCCRYLHILVGQPHEA